MSPRRSALTTPKDPKLMYINRRICASLVLGLLQIYWAWYEDVEQRRRALRLVEIAFIASALEEEERILLFGAHSKENMGDLVKVTGYGESGCTISIDTIWLRDCRCVMSVFIEHFVLLWTRAWSKDRFPIFKSRCKTFGACMHLIGPQSWILNRRISGKIKRLLFWPCQA